MRRFVSRVRAGDGPTRCYRPLSVVLLPTALALSWGVQGIAPIAGAASAPTLPSAIVSDGQAWQTFVTSSLAAIANHDGATATTISQVTPAVGGSLTFDRGPWAGTTVSTSTLAAVTSDSSGADTTIFRLLNGSSGLVERYFDCQTSPGSAGPVVHGTCQVTAYDLGSSASSTPTSVQTTSRSYSATAAADVNAADLSPDTLSCGQRAFAPSTEGSIYGPLITYTGTMLCNQTETLAIIDGLYNWTATYGYIAATYTTGASGHTSHITASGLAPCYAPYSPGDYFETAQLAYLNGSLFGGSDTAGDLPCAQISYRT